MTVPGGNVPPIGASTPDPPTEVHPIEQESYRILAERVDLSGWAPGAAAVAARIIHATAEPELAGSLVVDAAAVEAGVAALRAGSPVICDVEMVRSGVTGGAALCALSEIDRAPAGSTRTAAAMALAATRHPAGAVVVVGCAPTALDEVCDRLDDGSFRPALVIGVPVGFVGAAASKERLLEVAPSAGVPVIVLRGERGGAAVGVAAVNALIRLARPAPPPPFVADGQPPPEVPPGRARPGAPPADVPAGHAGVAVGTPGPGTPVPSLVLIGHGTRSDAGQAELRAFGDAMAAARPSVPVRPGFIEFMRPTLAEALESAASATSGSGKSPTVVAVPLVLLGAGHMKDDGPAALAGARRDHPEVGFSYGRDLGLHPAVLDVVSDRVREAAGDRPPDAVVLVGRGSSDPDANADLVKAARLLADGRRLSAPLGASGEGAPPLGAVEACFVSLARPDVADTLERCHRLGARRVVVVPYFLFAGILVDRIADQAAGWAAGHPDTEVVVGRHMGVDPRLVDLAWHRYDEATGGPVHMNCDGCLHRTPFPGYEHRVGMPPPTSLRPLGG